MLARTLAVVLAAALATAGCGPAAPHYLRCGRVEAEVVGPATPVPGARTTAQQTSPRTCRRRTGPRRRRNDPHRATGRTQAALATRGPGPPENERESQHLVR